MSLDVQETRERLGRELREFLAYYRVAVDESVIDDDDELADVRTEHATGNGHERAGCWHNGVCWEAWDYDRSDIWADVIIVNEDECACECEGGESR